jgi:plastocyanin
MTIGLRHLRIPLLLAVAAAGAFTATLAHGDDPPAAATFKTVDGVDHFQLVSGSGSATSAQIVTGGTVTFTNMSSEMHNVDFDQPAQGGVSCQQTIGGSASTSLRFPNFPTDGSWEGVCTFTRAGTYSFTCDMHPIMTGSVVVSDAGTTPPVTTTTPTTTPTATTPTTSPITTVPVVSTPPTTTPTSSAPTSGTPSGTPSDTQTPAKVVQALSVQVKLAQRGSVLRGAIAGARAGARVHVTLLARRSAIGLAGKPATLVGVGSFSALTTRTGTLGFVAKLNSRARSALAKHGRLAVTVRVTAPRTTGTLTRTFAVVLRPVGA